MGGSGELRAELAGGEVLERLEAANQLGADSRLPGALPCVSCIPGSSDQVAVRVGPQLGAGYDVVEALHLRADTAKAIKAEAAFTGVDGLAQCACSHEIDFLQVVGVRRADSRACRYFVQASARNLFRQPYVYHVARFASLNQTQCAVLDEPAQRSAHGIFR